MSTVHASDGEKISFAKGAPEVILANCSSIFEGGKTRKMTDGDNARIAGLLEEFSRKSLRVIAFSFNDSQKAINKDEQEKGMVFCGLAAMADPPREEVKDALEACRRGGIRVVMITGDNPNTAKAVGERIGLLDERSSVLTGADIDKFGEKEFEKVVREVNVFARTHPEHKLRIVNALRSQGEIVAMTGDGVNDAPALKRADIGIAMGIKGTDVSKEASDMVLSDDNFASIVEAVRNGRAIYENIQKTTAFIISRNYAEVFLLLITTLFLGVEYTPLVALQILFINLIDEEIPAFVLASDTPRKGIMNDRPRNPKEGILPSRLLALIFGLSIFTAIMVYGVYIASDPANDLTLARTVAFAAIISCVIFNTLSFKSLEEPLSLREAFSNRMLLLAIFGSLLLGLAAIYHPALQSIFHTTSLGMPHLIMAVLVGASTTIFIEAGKHLLKMLSNNKGNAIGQTINLVKQ